ncbi:NAD-dependent epimerase/dehydratase family protein [Streptomyces europaeiscabiei]|uniref:NAD(P)-dependent oxidoreductase n=5 Tax=Streptomyces europaeiscabiei TaxID=146819 RepID=A0ABU4NHT5_9ACTN|nr:NAD(P)-dependent oxidoreductase [Streptomyces europaeiscabiei]MDX2529538.1 NAD(P)-dependent oxidoreductase [Streptomyces europaeiscabiei]MDX2757826.1 NAD(P)-dependent oxidoreductase [Streptomyces europaeiscabiei]MDX2768138.1 NAD(P)-dependent oxidoreductase [Streptomyces europaeiscabiei]MDX3543724.1 NAD(P)-dependent oxidoreductase [Streptomyces europaeiscabiei]MDX3553439.1 NAD(P)-dependent oxidoreductase [Streptomyces europaeiscabiei]
MRVLVAGATGVVGHPLVGALRARGHQVSALVRQGSRGRAPEADEVVVADALDRDAVLSAVSAARPEVVVHQLSALRLLRDDPRGAFALTALLRTEGTAHLVEAARAAGARRLVAQSIAFAAAPAGEPVLDEDAPLYVDAPDPGWASTVRAVAELERQVTGSDMEGVVLRYGTLYGPRTAYARTGTTSGSVLAGRLPLPGGGAGIMSFLHVEDAVGAAVAGVEADATGVFHVTDDDPAPAAQWLPHLARVLAAPSPRTVPAALAPRLLGWFMAHQLTSAHGAANDRARTALGWKPARPSWRDGLGQE